MEKIYRVQMNSNGMPNFSTAVEVDTDISEYSDKLWRNAYERGKADRPQGEWIEVDDASISCRCSVCGWEAHLYEDDVYGMPYCPNCGARMKGAGDE